MTATDRREAGFTLIELLVVILIVGVLAAVAIPIYLGQRRKAADAALKSDLRAAAQAMESWYADGYTNADAEVLPANYQYLSSGGDPGVWPQTAERKSAGMPSIRLSSGTGVGIRTESARDGYCIVGTNKSSSYRYGQAGVGISRAGLLFYDSLDGGVRTHAQLTTTGACWMFEP